MTELESFGPLVHHAHAAAPRADYYGAITALTRSIAFEASSWEGFGVGNVYSGVIAAHTRGPPQPLQLGAHPCVDMPDDHLFNVKAVPPKNRPGRPRKIKGRPVRLPETIMPLPGPLLQRMVALMQEMQALEGVFEDAERVRATAAKWEAWLAGYEIRGRKGQGDDDDEAGGSGGAGGSG